MPDPKPKKHFDFWKNSVIGRVWLHIGEDKFSAKGGIGDYFIQVLGNKLDVLPADISVFYVHGESDMTIKNETTLGKVVVDFIIDLDVNS